MKTLAILLFFSLAGAATADDLTGNKFFKALEGKWKGRGNFTNTDEDPQLARNSIEAAFSEDGKMFTIKGGLLLGEDGTAFAEQPFSYRWEITRSSVEGLYAGRFITLTGEGGEPADYEVAIDESTLTAKLSQISGASGQNRFEIIQQIVGENYVVKIASIDSNGSQTTTGELTFTRVE